MCVYCVAVTFQLSEEDYRSREGGIGFMPVIISKDFEAFIANPIVFSVIPLTLDEAEAQGLIPDVIPTIPDNPFSPIRAGWRLNL